MNPSHCGGVPPRYPTRKILASCASPTSGATRATARIVTTDTTCVIARLHPAPPPPAPARRSCPSRGTSWLRLSGAARHSLDRRCAGRACQGRGGSGRPTGRMPRSGWCCWQLIEQLPRVPEVPGVEPLREPAIDGRKHFARLVTPTLSGQETRETDCSPQLQRLLLP